MTYIFMVWQKDLTTESFVKWWETPIFQAGAPMSPPRYQQEMIATEAPRKNIRMVIVFVAMIVMATLLGSSLLLYLFYGDDNDIKGSGMDNSLEKELVLNIDQWPSEIRSIEEITISGEVSDEDGIKVPLASVSVEFPDMTDVIYRTTSDPKGRFTIKMELPLIDQTSYVTANITASKEGYLETFRTSDLDYLRPPSWTFMIYMSDCDLEAWALKDLNELETIAENELVNIIVQLDRWESLSTKDDRSNGNWTTTKRFLVQKDDDADTINSLELEDLGEIDSSDPDELIDFAVDSMNRYPADIYSLILWNHGSGIDGICWEQSLESEEVMEIDELGYALSRITKKTGEDLDIIGFDACLMSAIEVAYEIHPHANTMISSEITEPAFGWDYTTLDILREKPYITPEDLGALLIEDYLAQLGDIGSKKSMSLGVYNLSLMDDIAVALTELSNTITDAGSTELYNMHIARKYAQGTQEGHSSDAVDLYDLIENIGSATENSQIKEQTNDLLELIDEAVIHFDKDQVGGWSIDGLHGLSVYAPDFKEVYDTNEDYSDLKFVQETSWSKLLLEYYIYLRNFTSAKVLSFDSPLLSCSCSDEDGDGFRDTMRFTFTVHSSEDDVEGYLALNVYNLRGDNVANLGLEINVSSDEPRSYNAVFSLEEEDGGPGLYRISAYLCRGNAFDSRYYQDYIRSGYRWLENKSS